jgi:hypothetical protein
LDVEVDISSAWEAIGENIKISGKESLGYYGLRNIISHTSTRSVQNNYHIKENKPNFNDYRIHAK